MKTFKFIFLLSLLVSISAISYSQKGKIILNTKEVPEETHVHLDDFPKDMVLPMIHGWGGLTVDLNNMPGGTDFRPFLVGLENDHCQVPHWGYIVEGAIQIEYEDGSVDIFRKGEAFYMRPGHTGEVLENLKLVSFSPEKGMHELGAHLEKKVAEQQEQQAKVSQ